MYIPTLSAFLPCSNEVPKPVAGMGMLRHLWVACCTTRKKYCHRIWWLWVYALYNKRL